jgi:hypothetical protein
MFKKLFCFMLFVFLSTAIANETKPTVLLKTSQAHTSVQSSNDYIVALA